MKLLWFILFFLFIPNIEGCQPKTLIINLIGGDIYTKYKAGKACDAYLLQKEFLKFGHQIYFFDLHNNIGNIHQQADINIFLENLDNSFFPYAKKNFFIINPEWFGYKKAPSKSQKLLDDCDGILTKTLQASKDLSPYTNKIFFLSFTSKDQYDKAIKKNYHRCLHLKGRSTQKGTDCVIKVWKESIHFPQLVLVDSRTEKYPPMPPNIMWIGKYLEDYKIRYLQNACGIHICTSTTEGFGHYIMEAMSTEAVVITTDAPPMNEFIQDPRCLVKYKSTRKMQLATAYHVDSYDLKKKVQNLLALPKEELRKIGQENRKNFEKIQDQFKSNLATFLEKSTDSHND